MTLQFDPTATASALVDIAEMADGTVWLAVEGYAAPLVKIVGYSLEALVNLGGLELSYLTDVTMEEVALPDAALYVNALHPAGYALGIEAGAAVQVWQYASGAWALIGRAEGPALNGIIIAGAEVLFTDANGLLYRLAGSSVALATVETVVSEAARQLLSFHELDFSAPLTARWRDRWYRVLEPAVPGPGLVRWEGADEAVVSPMLPAQTNVELPLAYRRPGKATASRDQANVVAGPWQSLLIFGQRTFDSVDVLGGNLGFWGLYDGRQWLLADDQIWKAQAGHATGLRTWLVGYRATTRPYLTFTGDGGTTVYAEGAIFLCADEELHVSSLTVEATGLPNIAASGLTVEAGIGAATDSPAVSSLTVEAGIGAATDSPALSELTVEAIGLPEVALSNFSVEAGVGSGTESPEVSALTVEAAAHTVGPSGGGSEGVRWLLSNDADRIASAIQLTPRGGRSEMASLRALVRVDNETAEKRDWATYTAIPIGPKVTLPTPGHYVRVAIIWGGPSYAYGEGYGAGYGYGEYGDWGYGSGYGYPGAEPGPAITMTLLRSED